jgi:hypothetical protein
MEMFYVGCADAGSASYWAKKMRFLRQHILHPFLLFACLWVKTFFPKGRLQGASCHPMIRLFVTRIDWQRENVGFKPWTNPARN